MRFLLSLVGALIAPLYDCAAQSSLLLKAGEQTTEQKPSLPEKPGTKTVKLNAILYQNSKSWTIWLNRTCVTPQKKHPFITVHSLNAQRAVLSVGLGPKPFPITLGIGQVAAYDEPEG